MTEYTTSGSAPTPVPALVIGGIGIIRSLGEAGVPVYAGSDVRENHILFSRYVKKRIMFSDFHTAGFVEDLIALAKAEGTKLMFFSDDDRAILTFSQNQDLLRPFYYFNMPPAGTVEAILDKRMFSTLAQELGLPVPWSLAPGSVDELLAELHRVTYPCIIKPAHKDDWWTPDFRKVIGRYRKAIECRTRGELCDYFGRVLQVSANPLIQELVEGDDSQLYSINMYYDAGYRLKGYYTAHKHRTYPVHAGQGCFIETVKDDEVLALSVATAEKLRIRGLCNIQYKRDRDGRLNIMELHVRNSVWSYLGTASGMNLYFLAYLDQMGNQDPSPDDYETGVKFVDLKRDVKALLAYRKSGEWTIRRWLKSLRGKRIYHLPSWKDPVPCLMDLWFELVHRVFRGRIRAGTAPRERQDATGGDTESGIIPRDGDRSRQGKYNKGMMAR